MAEQTQDSAGKKLVLIDGHSILNRAFYGMPDLTNAKGVHTGAVYGFLNILFKILEEEKADYLTVAFDVHAPTFRHEKYAEYKGTRKPMPPELREQVPLLKEVLAAMEIAVCEQAGLEADDILGTLARRAEAAGMEVSLVSGDRDLLQIATEHIMVRIPKTRAGQTTIENYHAADVLAHYQVTPRQFIDLKALMGDTADNIPGVPKVGEKTATGLIVTYGSVDGVYEHLDEITKKALKETLTRNKDKAYLSLDLATIRTDCDIAVDEEQAKITNFYTRRAFELFTELNFKNYLGRFAREETQEAQEESAPRCETVAGLERAQEIFARLREWLRGEKENGADGVQTPEISGTQTGQTPEISGTRTGTAAQRILSFYTVSEKTDAGTPSFAGNGSGDAVSGEGESSGHSRRLLGVALGAPEATYFFRTEGFLTGAYLGSYLGELRRAARESGGGGMLACFDVKNQYDFLNVESEELENGIRMDGIFDLLLGSYLVNPLKNDYTPEDVASEYLQISAAGAQAVFGKKSFGEAMEEMPEETMAYACRTAELLRKAAPLVQERLRTDGMQRLYEEIELPLTYVLHAMERLGIRTDEAALRDYSAQLDGRIQELEAQIHEETGEPDFNIASPKQLGEVLFEKMHLTGGKKTKTGYSTAADVLEKLAPDYPVVADILEYRALTKLKSTYADGLSAFIGADGRIHSTFHQTITATGRLSSADPNLQNIPMRTDLGRRIRKAFLPREGYLFADADYSQIELRILAHMSGDEELIEAYRQNEDIHRITASKVFHTPFEEVTPLQRRNAKAVNFGIVYGISSFGLSQDLSISRKEAADYIEAYFRTYPGVKHFLDQSVEEAKKKGYVTTMFGRRRPIPELKSSNFMQRSFGERVAMNSPIQGSAADIMKIAMIRVYERLRREHRRSQLILQIHDELLIETNPSEVEAVCAILSGEMKRAADLRVTLETDVHTGTDWYEAK